MEKTTVLKVSMLPFCKTNDAYVTDWSCGFNNSGEVSCEVIAILVKFLTDTCTEMLSPLQEKRVYKKAQ